MPDHNDFIAIGKIVKTIGIKGNVKIIPLTDFPERFIKLKKLFLFDERKKMFFEDKLTGNNELVVSECRLLPGFISIRFENYASIESSRELIGLIVMIREKDRMRLKKGSYYYYELIGCDVFNKGELIGKVSTVVDYGSGDLFNVEYNGKDILIPYRDEFVKGIDPDEKRIDVELIEGFLDEDTEKK